MTTYSYDANGNRTALVDPLQHHTTYREAIFRTHSRCCLKISALGRKITGGAVSLNHKFRVECFPPKGAGINHMIEKLEGEGRASRLRLLIIKRWPHIILWTGLLIFWLACVGSAHLPLDQTSGAQSVHRPNSGS